MFFGRGGILTVILRTMGIQVKTKIIGIRIWNRKPFAVEENLASIGVTILGSIITGGKLESQQPKMYLLLNKLEEKGVINYKICQIIFGRIRCLCWVFLFINIHDFYSQLILTLVSNQTI